MHQEAAVNDVLIDGTDKMPEMGMDASMDA